MSECEICEQKGGHHVLCPNYASAFIEEQNAELAALRTKLEEAQQEAALHKTRCAAILFSGAIHLNTGGEVQGWEREYVNQRARAEEAERKLAEAEQRGRLEGLVWAIEELGVHSKKLGGYAPRFTETFANIIRSAIKKERG